MTANEATRLLPASEIETDDWSEQTVEGPPVHKGLELWQLGAFGGILLAYSDTSLVWATHETVASHFNSLNNSSWVMTIFAIGYCITLPLYARLSDNYGRLGPLISSYVIFCIGCTICGFCEAYWQLLSGRVLTGCGASGVISLASIIVTVSGISFWTDIAEPSDVAVLRSYLNVASTVGLSLGGPLGGLLGGTVGWRWSFLGQVPIAVCCCLLIARGLRTFSQELQCDGGQQPEITQTNFSKPTNHKFDYPGALSLAVWITALLSVIDLQNQYSWDHPLILSLTIIGVISAIVFLILESYPGNRQLLVPVKLLRTEVGAFCAGQILILGSCHGFVSQIAPYFANTHGSTDTMGGILTIPSSIGNALGNLLAGYFIKRFGNYKRLSLISLAGSITICVVMLIRWQHFISYWESLITFPHGLFAGAVLSTQFIGLYIFAPKEHMATAISMYYMSQQIGIAFGISICSNLLKTQFEFQALRLLIDVPNYREIIKRVLVDSSVVAQLPRKVQVLLSLSYLNSFWTVPTVTIVGQLLALLPMLLVPENNAGLSGNEM